MRVHFDSINPIILFVAFERVYLAQICIYI